MFASALPVLGQYAEREDCVWINAILARLVCQWYDSAALKEQLATKISREVSDLTSSYVGALCLDEQLELEEITLPIEPPTIKNVSVHGGQNESFVSFCCIRL